MDNKFEITKEQLKEILKEKSMTFTLAEIEEMMEAEMMKPDGEMDTELVDMCANALEEKYNISPYENLTEPMFRPWDIENTLETMERAKKKRTLRIKRVLLAVAAVVLVFAVGLTAGAQLISDETSDKIIRFYEDHFEIDLGDKETTQSNGDWINELIIGNLHTRLLPQVLLSEDYEKKASVQQDDDKTVTLISINNSVAKISGKIMITEYKNENINTINGSASVSNIYDYFKEILVNETKVIVFGNDEKIYINYVDGSTGYEISLDCDFETAVSIAETIK